MRASKVVPLVPRSLAAWHADGGEWSAVRNVILEANGAEWASRADEPIPTRNVAIHTRVSGTAAAGISFGPYEDFLLPPSQPLAIGI